MANINRKQIEFEKQIIKPFEFILKINDHIICQRYFSIKKYNNDCRESLDIKYMMDDIMGVNQKSELGLIPEFFKYKCIDNSYKTQYEQSTPNDKDDVFSLEILKNNVNKLRGKDGNFNYDLIEKESIIIGMFDGKIFNPNVRYEIDIRGIIPDIISIIQDGMSQNNYTKLYGDVKLYRNNILTSDDYARLETY